MLAIVSVSLWITGRLFVAVPDATVAINGIRSDSSRLFKSSQGEYFVILDVPVARNSAYWVEPSGRFGVPTGPVPSLETLSINLGVFLIALDYEKEIAGTEWFAPIAHSSLSTERINLDVGHEKITVELLTRP